MDPKKIKKLLKAVQAGSCPVDEALKTLGGLPFEDLGFAKVDHHRGLRCGFAEVVFGPGKRIADLMAIVHCARRKAPAVLVTRLNSKQAKALRNEFPTSRFNDRACTICIGKPRKKLGVGTVLIVSAGTSDIPVAEEARETLAAFGAAAELMYDTGVAGLHRLLQNLPTLRKASVIIVVAGMEGALPSVVGGLVSCPVIAVPTSVGYGASLGGIAALMGMLNSCASGISVVNIDNGFGAAAVALRILLRENVQTEAPDTKKKGNGGRTR